MNNVGLRAGVLALLATALPLLAADIATILAPTTDFSKPEPYERHPGGATTQVKTGKNAFSLPAANLQRYATLPR